VDGRERERRKVVTVLFCDVAGSTALGESLDAEALRTAAGKNVLVMGGADLLRQYLAAGLVDEFTLTIAPVLLGAGKRLFDGISAPTSPSSAPAVIESPFATHLRFRVHLCDQSVGKEKAAAAELEAP
jgi:riboflavin biosynthesis pyrimidine reductase